MSQTGTSGSHKLLLTQAFTYVLQTLKSTYASVTSLVYWVSHTCFCNHILHLDKLASCVASGLVLGALPVFHRYGTGYHWILPFVPWVNRRYSYNYPIKNWPEESTMDTATCQPIQEAAKRGRQVVKQKIASPHLLPSQKMCQRYEHLLLNVIFSFVHVHICTCILSNT